MAESVLLPPTEAVAAVLFPKPLLAELGELNAEPVLEVPSAPNADDTCPKVGVEVDTGAPPKMLPVDDGDGVANDVTLLKMLPAGGDALELELTPSESDKPNELVALDVA